MSSPLLAVLLTLAQAKVELSVNVKTNEVLSGHRTFRATVAAEDPITQVEFYVGDELRDSDSSTPYEFKLDTIEESDGPLRLTFAAYTSKGDSAKKTVQVRVDNETSKGAQFHAQRALDLVADSKWDEAIEAGRIALKADAKSTVARAAMARAYMGKGVWDKAQKHAEDYLAAAPESVEARGLVAGINTLRALRTLDRGTDREATLSAIREALKTAIESRRKLLGEQVDAVGEPTDANIIQYSDAALRARRYSLVITALTPRFRKDATDSRISNRLAFAQLSAGRQHEALQTLNQVEKFAKLDSYGFAMKAILHAIAGDRTSSDEYLKEALLADPNEFAVRSAQTYLALWYGRYDLAGQLLTALQKDFGQRPEAQYYSFSVLNAMGDYEKGRTYFERAVLAEPLQEAVYIEQGKKNLHFVITNKVGLADAPFQTDAAEAMFEAAQLVRPESYQAILGLALVELYRGNIAKAVSYSEAGVSAAPNEPAGYFILSAAQLRLSQETYKKSDEMRLKAEEMRKQGNTFDASETQKSAKALAAEGLRLTDASKASVAKAGELEPRLKGHGTPRPFDVWRYFQLVDRPIVMPLPR